MGYGSDFKDFAFKGNVVDLAVGLVLGVAFGLVVASLVSDVLMPPVGLLLGDSDMSDLHIVLKEGTPTGPYPTLDAAKEAGAITWNWGAFVNQVISFLIIALAMFIFVVNYSRAKKRMEANEAPTPPKTKPCPHCITDIPAQASRCPACTGEVA